MGKIIYRLQKKKNKKHYVSSEKEKKDIEKVKLTVDAIQSCQAEGKRSKISR